MGGMNVVCGTPCYMSPELVSKKTYQASQVDVWALGVLLFRILVGSYPFQGCTNNFPYLTSIHLGKDQK